MRLAGRGGTAAGGRGVRDRVDPLHEHHARRDPHPGGGVELRRPRGAAARLLLRGPRDPVPGDRARVRAATGALAVVKRHFSVIVGVGGAVMIALGLLILTGEFTVLNAKANSLLQGTGLVGI